MADEYNIDFEDVSSEPIEMAIETENLDRVQIITDISTNWTALNPVLAQGDIGYETDTNKFKFGDGIHSWNQLQYYAAINTNLERSFTYSELLSGPITMGLSVTANRIIQVILIVSSAFDVGTLVIGDDSAHGRLMVAADNDLTKANIYVVEPMYKYDTAMNIRAWLETGSPSQGSGIILVIHS